MNSRTLFAAATSFTACMAVAAEIPLTHTEPVVVIATRFPHDAADAAAVLTVIDRAAIDRSTARTVVDLLSQQAGIQFRDSTGGPDLQVDMRGFGQTGDLNTTVLVDGQRFNDIDTSPVRWSAIPLSAVERVEIMRGSGAVLYGSGATGGVINIVTRRARAGEKNAELAVGLGSFNTVDLQGAASIAGDTAGMRINVSDYRSDNYRDNNRLRQSNVLVDVRTLGRSGHVYAKIAADAQDLRNPGQLTLAELAINRRAASTPLDYSNRDGARVDVGGVAHAGAFELAANVAYRQQQSRAHFTAFAADVANDTDNIAFSPRAKLAHRLGGFDQSLVAGVDLEEGRLDRNVTGVFFAGHSNARQERRAAYVQNNAALGPDWALTLGARTQRAENVLEDPLTAAAPLSKRYALNAWEVVLRDQVTPALALYGKAGRSFRLPSVEETNFTSPALLEPQTSRDGEIGLEVLHRGAYARVSLYRMDIENEIAFNPILFDNVNLAPTRREGAEVEGRMTVNGDLSAFFNYAHVIARFRSGVYGGIDVAGNTVPLVPRNAASAGFSWLVRSGMRLSAAVRYVGEQRFANDEANTLAQTIPAYTTVDLKLTHEAGPWKVEAGIRNLLAREYYTQGGVSGAGVIRVFPASERSGYVGVRRDL